ncbi:Chromatin assembly factor 1 subunit A [Holothuria leucospilota]|uniref:Chromatin assembly factor 1 subunit A n=1 Tax=Holothuria leucospilota TaxID=206669 RepID=A0A9Q1BME6_HOLLE|nr:Chromatin assembly factor 1 subunit A [Holothuria leucospilota]
MIGEVVDNGPGITGSENKKRNLDAAGKGKTKDFLSPPSKKMKQARLPFAPKLSPNNPVTVVSPQPKSPAPKKRRVSEEASSLSKFGVNKLKRTPTKSPSLSSSTKPAACSTPKSQTTLKPSPKIIIIEDEEQVPSSSSEVVSSPKSSLFKPPPKSNSLDGFLQTTQQPQVSTSDCIDLTDDSEMECDAVDSAQDVSEREDLDSSASSRGSLDKSGASDDGEAVVKVSQSSDSCKENSTSSEKKQTSSLSATPETHFKVKTGRGKPKSQKALEKEKEKQRQREEKARLREEKRLKLEAEKKEKEEQRRLAHQKRQQEQEEARKEKEAKRKERQARREKEDEEREEKRKLKQEARQKKQEELDLLQAEKKKKQEEKRKLEEEKQKELEEAKKKSEKQQMMFKSFFKKPCPDSTPSTTLYQDCGPFAAYQLRKDMVIAPTIRTRKMHNKEVKQEFDNKFLKQNSSSDYLKELSSGNITVGRSERTKGSRKSTREEEPDDKDSDIEEVPSSTSDTKGEVAKAKLLQFHENYRPPYFGTWRKRSQKITGRQPLAKDEDLLDYEVDSDDEWEDPGESLSDSGEEDEEDNDNDSGDESDDGFFVPHGYLSEDEVEGADDDRETWEARRAAKAKDWDREMRKKTEDLKTFLIGCIWKSALESASQRDIKYLESFKAVPLVSTPILLTGVAKSSPSQKTQNTSNGQQASGNNSQILAVHNKIRPVPKEAMPDLIRLVHGNIAGIKSLCREFKEFWKRKNDGRPGVSEVQVETKDSRSRNEKLQGGSSDQHTPEKVEVSNGTPEKTVGTTPQLYSPLFRSAEDFEISKRQLEKKISKIAVRDKRQGYSKICWYVHEHILKEHKMESSPVPSTWKFITKKAVDPTKPRTPVQVATPSPSQSLTPEVQTVVRSSPVPSKSNLLAMFPPVSSPKVASDSSLKPTGSYQMASATLMQLAASSNGSTTMAQSPVVPPAPCLNAKTAAVGPLTQYVVKCASPQVAKPHSGVTSSSSLVTSVGTSLSKPTTSVAPHPQHPIASVTVKPCEAVSSNKGTGGLTTYLSSASKTPLLTPSSTAKVPLLTPQSSSLAVDRSSSDTEHAGVKVAPVKNQHKSDEGETVIILD